MKKPFFSILIAVAWLTASPVSAGAETLTLNDFISRTIENNPTVRAYIQSYKTAAGEEFAARGIGDFQLESLFKLAKKESPQVTGISSTDDRKVAYGIGVSKIITQSGTRLGASYQDSWTKSQYPAIVTNLLSPVNPVYTPSVTLTLTQPLLKNWAGRQDQLGIRLSRIALDLSKVSYEENIEAFISEMTQLYLSWLRAFNDSRTLANVYNKVTEQVGLVREQVDAKVAEQSDLYRILEQQANYKALWEGALAYYDGYTKQVAAMMAPDNPPDDISPTGIENSFLRGYGARSDGLLYLKDSSRLKRILDYTEESQVETLKANKNARLPDLNFFVDYTRMGAASSFDRSHSSAFDNDDISGGLSLAVPLPNRAARGQYRAQQATVARVNYENERTMLDATSQLEALYEQERRFAQQVKAYKEQVYYGRKKIDEEKDQYDDGRLSLFQLLQDVQTWINQSLNYEASKVNLAQVRLLIGELTDVNFDAFAPRIDEVVAMEEE